MGGKDSANTKNRQQVKMIGGHWRLPVSVFNMFIKLNETKIKYSIGLKTVRQLKDRAYI